MKYRFYKKIIAFGLCFSLLLGNTLISFAEQSEVTGETVEITDTVEVEEPETEGTETGEPETEGTETGEPETEGIETGEPETEGTETGEPETEEDETGEPETEGIETGETETEGTVNVEAGAGTVKMAEKSTVMAARSSVYLLGLTDGSYGRYDRVLNDSEYLELKTQNAPETYRDWMWNLYEYEVTTEEFYEDEYYFRVEVKQGDEVLENAPSNSEKYYLFDASSQTFTITPAEDCEIESVALNGTQLSGSNGAYSVTLNKGGNVLTVALAEEHMTSLTVSNQIDNLPSGNTRGVTTFEYKLKWNDEIITEFSLDSGETVVFDSLEPGEYTVEQVLQEGYQSYWEINTDGENVTGETTEKSESTDVLEAVVVLAEDSTVILNFTNSEFRKTVALSGEKATCLDSWQDRTYFINIHASSASSIVTAGKTVTSEEKAAVDVVLVLDVSGSMEDGYNGDKNRISSLKTATKNFIQGIYDNAADDSCVAVVTFAGEGETNVVAGLTAVKEDNHLQTLKEKIDGLRAEGGTRQNEGLLEAEKILQADTSDHAKYVILFTDGKPGDYDDDSDEKLCTIADAAYKAADRIKKEQNAVIYTVRLGSLEGGSITYGISEWKEYTYFDYSRFRYVTVREPSEALYWNRTYVQWLEDLATSSSHSVKADQADALNKIFEKIRNEIVSEPESYMIPLENVTVTDVLDSRFELTEAQKKVFDQAGVSYRENTDGTTTIIWRLDSLGTENREGDAVIPGWESTVQIRAKDDFAGGNNIPTNVADLSRITVEGETSPCCELGAPAVNVKPNLSLKGKEITIFLGEKVPAEFLSGLPQGTKMYLGEQEVTAQEILTADLKEDTVYLANLVMDMGTPTPESNANTTKDGVTWQAGVEENGTFQERLTAQYIVRIVCGSITVEKKIRADEIKWAQGNPIFTLSVSSDSGTNYSETVEFTSDMQADSDGFLSLSVTFERLKKGIYTVAEQKTLRYRQKSIQNQNICIGCDEKGRTLLTATEGRAVIMNDRTYRNYFSDTDTVTNSVQLVNGRIVITPSQEKNKGEQ